MYLDVAYVSRLFKVVRLVQVILMVILITDIFRYFDVSGRHVRPDLCLIPCPTFWDLRDPHYIFCIFCLYRGKCQMLLSYLPTRRLPLLAVLDRLRLSQLGIR